MIEKNNCGIKKKKLNKLKKKYLDMVGHYLYPCTIDSSQYVDPGANRKLNCSCDDDGE